MYRTTFPRAIRNDNNLLITLFLLLKIRRVNAVADELCISQSAVSQQLSKLRELFDDQLLIRGKDEMLLTACALDLLPKLQSIIDKVEDVYSVIDLHESVKPTKKKYTVCTHGGDYTIELAVLIFNVLKELSLEKEVSFDLINRGEHSVDDLSSGKIDLFFGIIHPTPENVIVKALPNILYSFTVSSDHPIMKKKIISEDDLQIFEFVSLFNSDVLDELLKMKFNKIYGERKPFIRLQSTHAILKLIEHSDLFSILPSEVARRHNLSTFNLCNEELSLPVNMYWHESLDNDSFHVYFRNRLIELMDYIE